MLMTLAPLYLSPTTPTQELPMAVVVIVVVVVVVVVVVAAVVVVIVIVIVVIVIVVTVVVPLNVYDVSRAPVVSCSPL